MDILGLGLGPIIVIIIRLIVPFTLFRWPLFGGIACVVADTLDVVLATVIGQGDFTNANYSFIDKALDTYFLFFMVLVSLKWEPLAKWTSVSLFTYRFIGVILFEYTGVRALLFIFPNLFVFFYLFYATRNRFFPAFELTKKRLALILLVLLIPKLIQEYLLHIVQVHPWEWLNANVFKIGL